MALPCAAVPRTHSDSAEGSHPWPLQRCCFSYIKSCLMPSCSNKLASGLGSVRLHWESQDQKTFDLGVFWFHCGAGFGIKHGVPKAQALLWFQVQESQFGLLLRFSCVSGQEWGSGGDTVRPCWVP